MRRYEGVNGRHLIDTHHGGWSDLPSELVLQALALWRLRVRVPSLPVPRYLSVRDGIPQRYIDIYVLSGLLRDLQIRQSQLLSAAALGGHAWLYVVADVLTWSALRIGPGSKWFTAAQHLLAGDDRRSEPSKTKVVMRS